MDKKSIDSDMNKTPNIHQYTQSCWENLWGDETEVQMWKKWNDISLLKTFNSFTLRFDTAATNITSKNVSNYQWLWSFNYQKII